MLLITNKRVFSLLFVDLRQTIMLFRFISVVIEACSESGVEALISNSLKPANALIMYGHVRGSQAQFQLFDVAGRTDSHCPVNLTQ